MIHYVIEVLNDQHAKLVKEHFKRMGVFIEYTSFSMNKEENDTTRYYGIINSDMSDVILLDIDEIDDYKNIKILTLEEAIKLEPEPIVVSVETKALKLAGELATAGRRLIEGNMMNFSKNAEAFQKVLDKYDDFIISNIK